MLSKFISEGDKIDLQVIAHGHGENGAEQKTYYSTVYEILSDDTLEIMMPIEQNKLILLPVDSEYDVIVYGQSGLYQCAARIIDRYKSSNVYILVLELTSNLRKYQRREYYRFSCALEMGARNLMEEEIQHIDSKATLELQPGLPLKRSVIVDISGGGLRFMSEQRYEPESLICCSFYLQKGGQQKKYEVVGRILAARNLDNKPGTYEHRVQFYNMNAETREDIIKYIFEEERKLRNTEK
ncbi:MAG: flagellar brake protein [Lachnospiraceae bacterium]|nr:flagellar brake protein [Lachnospiraceae bacterium]